MSRRRARFLRSIAALLLGAALAAACAQGPDAPVEVGQPLRAVTLQGLNGPSRPLADFRGKPLLINVWASWCGPCREEAASLERLAWLDMARRFSIIGISTDDDPAEASQWLGRSNASISHFIDQRLELEHMLGATRLPLTVLVDAQGRVLQRIYGAHEWDNPESLRLLQRAFGLAD
jgi:thiol-disulfide isomerase/thioredoxin